MDRVNPNLPKYWEQAVSDADSVLVPLCGKSLDLLWLTERGLTVRGVEFVPEAVQEFFRALEQTPQVQEFRNAKRFAHDGLSVFQADFFALSPQVLEPSAAVYDRAALVAIAPQRRAEYFQKLHAFTQPGARLLLLNFVHDMESGPPFSIPETELRDIADGAFTLVKHAERDILSAEPRFAERASFMREEVWFGTRTD
jgi:thiopurine S-methyltransferase